MIAAIAGWAKGIILVVLFASFLELLLPASGMQRFVRVVMGLLVMLTMLSPLVSIVHDRPWAADVPVYGEKHNGRAEWVTKNTGKVVGERDRIVLDVYRNDLAKQIRAVVAAMEGVADAKVAVEVKEAAGGRPGEVEKVTVYVRPGQNKSTVKPVNIGEVHSAEDLPAPVKNKIASTLKELYQLRDSQLEIKRMG